MHFLLGKYEQKTLITILTTLSDTVKKLGPEMRILHHVVTFEDGTVHKGVTRHVMVTSTAQTVT